APHVCTRLGALRADSHRTRRLVVVGNVLRRPINSQGPKCVGHEQHVTTDLEHLDEKQLERTFRTNIFSMFYLVKAALPHLHPDARIINTSSITAYRGSPRLLDYSATKGAIVAFTRSLSQQLMDRRILVNAVAPGPVWTPLIPASFDAESVSKFGADSPMGRPGQASEIAPCSRWAQLNACASNASVFQVTPS
ncbi:MAG TPA: hypothetical protein DIT28_14045, partial [Oxalobacteraceae bacterium]|nr:hypothetical protein [Oxalobacteraceae bacterium]